MINKIVPLLSALLLASPLSALADSYHIITNSNARRSIFVYCDTSDVYLQDVNDAVIHFDYTKHSMYYEMCAELGHQY